MKKSLMALSLAGTTLLASQTFAGTDTGFFVGGSIAQSSLDQKEINLDTSNSTYKLFGGVNFGIIPLIDLGAELSFIDFGEKSDSLAGFGYGAFNFGPFGIFAKAGYVSWNSKIEELNEDSGGDAAYGIGARFQISSIQIRAEYEQFSMGNVNIDYPSIGAAWTF